MLGAGYDIVLYNTGQLLDVTMLVADTVLLSFFVVVADSCEGATNNGSFFPS